MSDAMKKVNEAAKWLDTLDMPFLKDWRRQVNVDTINMGSADRCVLGQVAKKSGEGNYDWASEELSEYEEWDDHSGAFQRYDAEWKEYLAGSYKYANNLNSFIWNFVKFVQMGNEEFALVKKYEYSGVQVMNKAAFLEANSVITPAPWKPGDVLKDQNGRLYLFKSEGNVLRFGETSLSWCRYEWYVKTDGRIFTKDTTYSGNNIFFGDLFDK